MKNEKNHTILKDNAPSLAKLNNSSKIDNSEHNSRLKKLE